jgi:acetyl esterase/lipase
MSETRNGMKSAPNRSARLGRNGSLAVARNGILGVGCALLLAFGVPLAGGSAARAQAGPAPRIDANVVFGRYSGLALLMDVHWPAKPNGLGVVYVPGSGFHTPLGYDALPITRYTRPLVPAFVDAGYTVFVINHRAAPRFRHPAALEDVQRAVRFVRSQAKSYGVSPDRLAAAGYSSGGTLASLVGVMDGEGKPDNPDPVDRLSARAQCVVAGGAAFDFTTVKTPVALPILGSYLGATLTLGYSKAGPEQAIYSEASPVTHVSPGDAPHFIFHGEQDEILFVDQADSMQAALQKAGVPVVLKRLPGANHGQYGSDAAGLLSEIENWLGSCLKPR